MALNADLISDAEGFFIVFTASLIAFVSVTPESIIFFCSSAGTLARVFAASFVISFFLNFSIASSDKFDETVLYSCTTVLLIFITFDSFSTSLPEAASGNASGFSFIRRDIPSISRIIS